ncbi:DUF1510 family protein [Metabacillus sp. RGM 3146]|uniref:DUF1510 family protein n=1 Tax=Metabacillus sp. RGM 3146 TaxID=3401092 RepID=UPI003B9A063D
MKGSRYDKRDKRRKTNVILNVLIGVIFVLIIVVGSQLIFGGSGKQQASKVDNNQQTSNSETNSNKQPSSDSGSSTNQEDKQSGTASDNNTSDQQNTESDKSAANDPAKDDAAKKDDSTSGSPAPKSDWKPVGTSQSEPHTTKYEKSSQDWAEMKKAMSMATGISEDNMTVWFIGNNGSPNDAKGTVSDKTTSEKYKVTLHWVTNEGWEPVNVEKAN